MSDLVGNTDCWLSHAASQMCYNSLLETVSVSGAEVKVKFLVEFTLDLQQACLIKMAVQ